MTLQVTKLSLKKKSSSVISSNELVRSVNNERDRSVKFHGLECQVVCFQRQYERKTSNSNAAL